MLEVVIAERILLTITLAFLNSFLSTPSFSGEWFRAEEEKFLWQILGYLFLIRRRVGVLVLIRGDSIRTTRICDRLKGEG